LSVLYLLDEGMDHLLDNVEVADHTVAQRTDRHDVGRGAADHALRLRPDGQDALGARVHSDDARLTDDDPAVAHGDQGVGRAEVDAHVVGEQAEQAVEDAQDASGSCWRGLVGPGTHGRCRGAGRMPHPGRRGNGTPRPARMNPSTGPSGVAGRGWLDDSRPTRGPTYG